jgi:predicted transcriptional regulator
MTPDPFTVTEDMPLADVVDLMEAKNVKRLPVMRGEKLVGILTRANVLQAVASLGRHVPDPTADDDHIRDRILHAMDKQDWCPLGLNVIVRDGIVHLSGVIADVQARQAAIVAAENVEGVVKVHDHIRWMDPLSGFSIGSPEDEEYARAS